MSSNLLSSHLILSLSNNWMLIAKEEKFVLLIFSICSWQGDYKTNVSFPAPKRSL